ncbi:hypothetical protein E2C01_059056 [Portunus trituberculatus]|uniref:Uncharacterized protein n=1 Tax=Portunus trituberculatus TaxID=210409 RepID=A0A5B7H819_PORTR|nr:hypothetical protein [Portunus trituberculatus]
MQYCTATEASPQLPQTPPAVREYRCVVRRRRHRTVGDGFPLPLTKIRTPQPCLLPACLFCLSRY